MKVCCSGSTQKATWRGGYETYDWLDHVLISSLLKISRGGGEEMQEKLKREWGREKARERGRDTECEFEIKFEIKFTPTIDILVEDRSSFLV